MNITYEEVSYDVAKDLIDSIIQNLLALAQLAYLALKGFSRQVLAEVSHYVQSLDWITLFTVISFTSTLIYLFPTIRATLSNITFAIIRRCHHFGARLFPLFFIHNPTAGPRWTPSYLLTDGLTHAHTIVPPHKGEYTFHQLQHHIVPATGQTVSLLPSIFEASAGLHPSCFIQVSLPARMAPVQHIQDSLQRAIDNGTSEASSALNLILRVNHHLTQVIHPTLVHLIPHLGQSLQDVMLTHPGPKEVCIALHNVLALKRNQNKLGALYPLCQDQHVIIAEADHNSRLHHRRRLNHHHGTALVTTHWINVPH